MRRDEEARLDIISSISEEHIDEVTGERITASAKFRRARSLFFKRLGAIAACFAVLIPTALIIILNLIGRGVPTYTGMTVSNTSPFAEESAYVSGEALMAGSGAKAKGKPIGEGVKDHFGVSKGQLLYYVKPGEDIYITVKIDNPKNYEILSFTLNGKKYSSYMFEDGSDMENLVLKVNVGEVSGLISYTIDAIKYVDGEKIKDVRMEGDRTVKIGVYNEDQPTASLSALSVKDGVAKCTLSVSDPEGLISSVGGKIYAVVYDGERVSGSREISLGDKEVTFEGLEDGAEYTIAAIAVFDAYDGQGKVPHVLCSEAFMTTQSIRATNVRVSGKRVNFDLSASNDSMTFTAIELLDAFGKVVFVSNDPITAIDNIPGGRLTLRVSYNYTDNGSSRTGTGETVFWCAEGMLPIIGEISFHYSDSVITHPISGNYTTHQATELTATTEDLGVYSISDGVVTRMQHYYRDEPLNAPAITIDGFIEVLDSDGVYHYYRFVKDMPFDVGDEVKLGEKLGVLYATGDVLTSGYNLHYACSTLHGEAKVYFCPSFDTPMKSENERLEDMLLANPIFKDGLTVSGKYGESVTVRITFNTVGGEESVILHTYGLPSYLTLTKIDTNVYDLTCDFSTIGETVSRNITATIYFDYFDTSWELRLTLTPTDVPPLEGGDGTEGDGTDGGDGTEGGEGGEGATEISIPEALAAVDGTAVVVRGRVSYVSEWNSTYGNCNATIKDAEGNTLYAYKLATCVALGDEVVITGLMTTYGTSRQIGEGSTAQITAAHGDDHNYQNGFCTVCGGLEPGEDHITVLVNIAEYATANGWISNRKSSVINADEIITVTASDGTNTGKYYSGDSTWRLYQSESATLTISAAEGKTILAVKIRYTYSSGGALFASGASILDGELLAVNSSSVTLDVGSTNGSTSGIIKITDMEIVYK
ncbi:MAG: hypothetical protein IJE25_04575 [Clostridia bacterium]|nr:hypothetical protein [Clostridia bacterium]